MRELFFLLHSKHSGHSAPDPKIRANTTGTSFKKTSQRGPSVPRRGQRLAYSSVLWTYDDYRKLFSSTNAADTARKELSYSSCHDTRDARLSSKHTTEKAGSSCSVLSSLLFFCQSLVKGCRETGFRRQVQRGPCSDATSPGGGTLGTLPTPRNARHSTFEQIVSCSKTR